MSLGDLPARLDIAATVLEDVEMPDIDPTFRIEMAAAIRRAIIYLGRFDLMRETVLALAEEGASPADFRIAVSGVQTEVTRLDESDQPLV